MKEVKKIRIDSIAVDGTYYTDEGYLVDHPIVTRCGILNTRIRMVLHAESYACLRTSSVRNH